MNFSIFKSLLFFVIFTGLSVFTPASHGMLCYDLFHADSTQVGSTELHVLPKPLIMNTRFEIFALSYPVKDASGQPNKDLPLYHLRRHEHYETWLSRKRASRPDVKIEEPTWETEENSSTKNLLHFLFFKTISQPDPLLGKYYETIPSPELFQHQRRLWNDSHTPDQHIFVNAIKTGDDSQTVMARNWRDGYLISIANPFHFGPGRDAATRPDENAVMNEDPNRYLPLMIQDKTSDSKILAENNHLFFHDVFQWTNALWMNAKSLERTRKFADFYLQLEKLIHEKGRNLEVSPPNSIRPQLTVGWPSASGTYTATRLLKDALHDSQRALHSITHILTFLVQNPQGLRPGVDYIMNRGPTPMIETEVHLQGLGVKAPGSKPPFEAPNLLRTWGLAKETTGALTLEDALSFITNTDIKRIQAVVAALTPLIPEVAALYKTFENNGTFEPVSPETLKQWANEIRWRYRTMGHNER